MTMSTNNYYRGEEKRRGARGGGGWDLQSSYAVVRMRNILVYVRRKIARVEHVRPKTSTIMMYLYIVDGTLRFGVTPGGGAPAGPLSRA